MIKEQSQLEAALQAGFQENTDVASSTPFSGGCLMVKAHHNQRAHKPGSQAAYTSASMEGAG